MADVSSILQNESVQSRFWGLVDKTGDCWLWRGTKKPAGYGDLWFRGPSLKAHRVAYMLFTGEFDVRQAVNQTCGNRLCCKPDHLFLGSRAVGQDLAARFWSKVDKSGNCWIWKASMSRDGYGKIDIGGRTISAHRLSLELSGVEIPNGMYALHSCDNPTCVRPEHLRVGTHAENSADMVARGRSSFGENGARAKLREADVLEMRKLATAGVSKADLSRRFGVTGGAVYAAINGRTWKHLPLAPVPDTMEADNG